jgi:hypothetical protein
MANSILNIEADSWLTGYFICAGINADAWSLSRVTKIKDFMTEVITYWLVSKLMEMIIVFELIIKWNDTNSDDEKI